MTKTQRAKDELDRLAKDWPINTRLSVPHDQFTGKVRGYYFSEEEKPGLVLQFTGTRIIHVYGEKWFTPGGPLVVDVPRIERRAFWLGFMVALVVWLGPFAWYVYG